MTENSFENVLRQANMAQNTITAYLYAVKEYNSKFKELNKKNLLVYKTYLIETYKPKKRTGDRSLSCQGIEHQLPMTKYAKIAA